MANLYTQRIYDNALLIRALSAAIVATETGAIILDMGMGLFEADLIVDYSALDVVTGDEGYRFIIQGSPDATFGTAANIQTMGELIIGGSTATGAGTNDLAAGRLCINFRNERNGVLYRYLRLKTVIAGTTPSIVFKAFLSRDL